MLRLATRFGGVARLATFKRWRSGSAPPAPPPPPSDWVVTPAPTFTQGAGQTYDVAATGPVNLGYTAGGAYDVASGSLPSSMSLSITGTLTDGGAGVGTSSVTFGYNEPGALPTFTLHSGTPSGTLPWMGTVYPVEGAVPAGMSLSSPQDTSMRASVLSTWPDGSAQVMVVAGHKTGILANSTTTVQVRPAIVSDTPMTTTNLIAIVSSVSVNFGTPLSLTLTTTNHDRIWWANSQVICARYRLPITNKGDMEAVFDVHAFANGRAFVEAVIENGRTNTGAATVTAPATQSYTNATVSVNGVQIQGGAGVSSPTALMAAPRSRNVSGTCRYQGGHTAFRAWYCSGWVNGDPAIEVTHDATSMMAHPWFFERAVAQSYNLQTNYTTTLDTYEPWSYNRLRFPRMNGGGDDEEIGLVTATQADYILSGNRYARAAVLATGLAPLSADLCIRHTDGSIPTRAQVVGKNTGAGTWPVNPEPANDQFCRWGGDSSYIDGSHVPAVGLVPFLCRPSPCFIEIAQREFLFHHANYNSTDGSHSYDQARARGWRARNMATAIFLTPDSDSTRKDGYRTALVNQINMSRSFMDQAWNTYDHIWEWTLSSFNDQTSGRARFQTGTYMHWLIALCWHSIANGKVLRGADQTMMEAAADQVMNFPLRWINDAPSFEWRLCPYQTTVGILSGSQVNPQFTNLTQEHTYDMTGTAPSSAGPWLNIDPVETNWANVSPQTVAGTGSYYPEHTWFVLCCAVERGVSGAEAAWSKVYGTSGNGGINNFSTWIAGLGNLAGTTPASRAYLNRFPRNK
jgi:hypothetical protein